MARDILSDYGPNRASSRRATPCGGYKLEDKRDVNRYAPPQGPKHIMETGVGLRGGTNHGKAGMQGQRSGRTDTGGMARLGGENFGNNGSQGRR